MKMKTTEEMKAAVLAYCEEVCPDTYKPHIVIGGFVSIWRKLKWNLEPYFEVTIGNKTSVIGLNETSWQLLYRLLGLESRDAVEAEKSRSFKEIDSCTLSLGKMAIRAKMAESRNAALVAALEAMKYKAEMNGRGYDNKIGSLYMDVCNALQAYKKGGTND